MFRLTTGDEADFQGPTSAQIVIIIRQSQRLRTAVWITTAHTSFTTAAPLFGVEGYEFRRKRGSGAQRLNVARGYEAQRERTLSLMTSRAAHAPRNGSNSSVVWIASAHTSFITVTARPCLGFGWVFSDLGVTCMGHGSGQRVQGVG